MPSDPERFDYFISYAHDDDRPPRGENAGWVTVFMEVLESALRKLGLRDDVTPFTDRATLRGTDDLDQQIVDALGRTDLLITLLSPSYFSSKYCMREQEIFVSKNRTDGQILVVELDRIDTDEMARLSFKNRRAVKLWQLSESGRPMPMAYPVPQPTDRDFYARVYELAIEVADAIKARRKAASAPVEPVPAEVTTAPAQAVVVAEVTEDLDQRREQLIWRLKDAGHPHVLLDSHGLSTDDFVAKIDRELGAATHFAQLLGTHPGRARPGAPNGYPRLQYDRAAARGGKTTIMQWRDPVLDPTKQLDDLQYRDLLEMPTVQAVSFDKFKETMFAALRTPVAAAATGTGDAPGGQKHVFVNYDDRDAKVAETIFDELETGHMVFGPPPADTDEEYREKIQEELIGCDGMMIVYGDSGSKWVHARLAEFSKVIPKRKSMLKRIFVLRTPPNDRPLPPVRLPGLTVVDWVEGKSLSELGVSFS